MKLTLVANLYNPHEQSKEQLINRFVVRHEIFNELYEAIKSSDTMTPRAHYLIEGQRGAGKTTLLLRLSYEIENDPDLQHWLIPIVFKEEAYYGIRRLFNLWEMIMYELEGKHKAFSGLLEQVSTTYDGLKDYERVCFEALIEALENADREPTPGPSQEGNGHPSYPPQGGNEASPAPLRQPFDFAQDRTQDRLSQEGITEESSAIPKGRRIILFIDNLGEMLRNFSNEENQRLHDILINSPHFRIIGASTVVFEALFSVEHPFYGFFQKRRLEGLDKEATYNILLELAKTYDKEAVMRRIIEQQPGRVESLRILTGGVIRTIILLFEIFTEQEDGNTLADMDTVLDRVTPLYKHRMDDLTPMQREVVNTIALNWDALSAEEIAREMRLNVDEVETVLSELENVFIIERTDFETQQPFYRLKERFLNIWYLMRLSSGGSRAKVVWLLHFLESWYSKTELIQHARKHIQAVATGRYQSKSAYYLTEAFAQTGQLDQDTEYQMILATRRLLQETDTHLAAELSPSDKEIFKKGETYYQREKYEEAIIQFLKMKHQDEHIHFRVGYAFNRLNYYQEAVSYLSQAAKKGHVEAMLHLGWLYHYHLQDYPNAEKYYLMAVEKKHADAMLYLGQLYHRVLQDYQNAEKYYLMVIKEAELRSKVLTSRGFSLKGLRNYLLTAIKGDVDHPERYQIDDLPGAKKDYLEAIKATASEALFQLGNLYANELKHAQKAETYYHKAAEAGHVKAIMNLADLYNYRLKDYKKAEKYYRMAAKKDDLNAIVNLGLLYHEELKEYKEAEKYYTMAAEKGDVTSMNALAWLYFEQQREKQKSLEYARKTIEIEKNIYTAHTAACIYLWNDYTEEAIQLAEEFMYSKEAYDVLENDILVYLMLLLAKQCYQQGSNYFTSPELNLQERFKPLYYAFMYFIEDPNYPKCPPELSEPVKDIIRQVKQMKDVMQ